MTGVTLADRRRLALLEVGDPDGTPCLYLHGQLGSRLEVRLLADAATRHRIRLIGVDRPGVGGSDPRPQRSIPDFAADVAGLADRLGLDRFAVLGFSGGGPYALACAAALPDRVSRCAVVSSAGPASRLERWTAGWWPWLSLSVARLLLRPRRRGRGLLRRLVPHWRDPDRAVLLRPEVRAVVTASWAEAFAGGLGGAVLDARLLCRDWGFDPARAAAVPVLVWHGRLDRVIPWRRVRRPVARLAARGVGTGHRVTVHRPRAGHLTTLIGGAEEILAALADVVPQPAPNPRAGWQSGGEDAEQPGGAR